MAALIFTGVSETVSAEESLPTVDIRWQGEPLRLTADVQKELCEETVRLVESSNFNSTMEKFGALMDVKAYRQMQEGNCLTMTFSSPRIVKTVGGNVTVAKTFLWLDGPGGMTCLFTADDTGGVTGHGKYSGAIRLQLLDRVKTLTPE